MKRCGLIGNPVEHSLSPIMQSVAFLETGVAGTYELWQTSDAEVPGRVASLRSPEVLGANVTVPHKQLVMPECDEVSDTARRIGAVNTIINRDGRLVGDNTDAYGFAMTVTSAGVAVTLGDEALVLGAGGAARAVIVALQDLGFGVIRIANRSPERAASLARDLDRNGTVSTTPWDALAAQLPSARLLVNATSLGWHEGELPLDDASLGLLPETATVVDLTYRETDLLRLARARGFGAVDGLDMLIHQGAKSFQLWTGFEAPVPQMRAAVEAEQQRRARL